ncbi:DUF6421 family protein [Streptomyces sp. NPDC017520]|uniref:DUF6421 family protein n=1 Tax=Streptomyces sp. NPDC017520 TaxID=3364998 RepID=UPI003788C2A2
MKHASSTVRPGADEVIEQVNRLRQELGDRDRFREPGFLNDLADRLADTKALRLSPVVRAFIEDIREFGVDQRLFRTKALVNAASENSIFGLFDASYFPSLSLEFLKYRTLPTDARLIEGYPSPTMPVVIEEMSEGFRARTVVALFPENYIDGVQEPDDLIFYFIDKFVERHLRLTRLLIDEVMAPEAFPLVRSATEPMLEAASAWWVRLHEYHHRQGDMPIPDYLAAKKSKALAGLEELRTDVSSMLVCLKDEKLASEMSALTYQFILAERLLRYSVEGTARPNYDAIASQLLFTYLTEAGGIFLVDGRIHLSPDLPTVLEAFLGDIKEIERQIHEKPLEQVKQSLLDFANRYAHFDESTGDYRHLAFFADTKKRLGI